MHRLLAQKSASLDFSIKELLIMTSSPHKSKQHNPLISFIILIERF